MYTLTDSQRLKVKTELLKEMRRDYKREHDKLLRRKNPPIGKIVLLDTTIRLIDNILGV